MCLENISFVSKKFKEISKEYLEGNPLWASGAIIGETSTLAWSYFQRLRSVIYKLTIDPIFIMSILSMFSDINPPSLHKLKDFIIWFSIVQQINTLKIRWVVC